ncbi:DMT family transporter [Roseisalinus antarcticus]|uniref:EamA-like transporter family protein n=1 Tax=Roseisalinus antarcticus TaxID=254357 RepID=A0A1Y5SRX4_9RHOB|nr:DMT family transporter [Roseisalinus antarcticus]SLN47058.1 EamA-like transporter family protein [Roseisalinus antarcticus]
MSENGRLVVVLVLLGMGWGLSMPLTKIAVRDGYGHFGLVFWQLAIGAVVLGALQLIRRRPLPITPTTVIFCTFIAVLGTILPNSVGYNAAYHLPAGIMSIAVSTVAMFAFPVALALGNDRFSVLRLLGLVLGLAGVALIALPETSLPDPAMGIWILIALIAPMCYALEGNIVAKWGTHGMGPIQTLFGASVIGAVLALPLALGSGQFIAPHWPPAQADLALIALSTIHAVVYSTYVWLVGRAGSVFAAQVSYLVMGFGVLWSMALLGERYALWIWAAFALMLTGVALVQPRGKAPLAPAPAPVQTARRPGNET